MRGAYSSNLLARVIRGTTVAILLLAPIAVVAQSFRGSIRGEVTDPSGAVIPNARITVTGVGNGVSRVVTSGPDGAYVAAELPAGSYDIAVEVSGFQTAKQAGAIVEVGRDTTVDFHMTLRGSDVITVTAPPPLVETTRDVLGEVVELRLVTELPLNGRDFGKLVALVPGATVEPSGVAAIQSGFGQFSINGNRDRSNNYTVDGTDNNDPFFNNSAFNQTGIGGAPASLLPIDAIQEFNLESQFPAEYGRNSGSVINILTKSGSNGFHGSAFEFLRNSALDARNYFNRVVDPSGAPVRKSPFRNNNFGASLGGPIIRNKTSFFGAYEGQRERVASDFSFLVPTQAQINGALTLLASNGMAASPALSNILGLFQALPGYNGTSGVIGGTDLDKNSVDSFIVKIDHQLSASESLTGRYALARSQQVFPLGGLGFGAGSRLPEFAQTSPTRVQLVSVSWLSTLSPSKINEVRFGYSRYRTSFSALDAATDPAGFGTVTVPFNLGTGKLGLPEIDFGGTFENLGASGFSIPRGRVSQSFQILDNFTWVRGLHTIKFGGEFRRAVIDSFNDNLERGIFSFSPESSSDFALCPGLPTDPPVCSDGGALTLASFYDGNTSPSADAGNTHRNTFNNGFSFFAQDDFRVIPTLTLNYGLRWEYFGPLGETHNLLSNLGRDGNLAMVGTDGLDRAYNRDLNNFGPRFGFSWNPLPRTVVRGGYGIYYDYIPQDLLVANFTTSAGLATNPIGPQAVVSLNYDATAWNGTNAGGPILTLPVGKPPAPLASIFVTPRNLVTPYAQNWNFNVQREFGSGVAAQLGYVGSKGTKLVRLRDANQPDPSGNIAFPQYGAVDQFATISSSVYHAMQATLRTHRWRGLSGFAGYTWSKSLDDASDGIDFNFSTVAFPQDSLHPGADRGPSNFDTRHRFTSAFSYQLPAFGSRRRLSQGWELNTIVAAQSGRPVPIVSTNDTNVFNFHQRPNMVPGVNPIVPNWQSSPDGIGYLNAAAFIQPAAGTFGTMQRNSIYGPQFWSIDFAVTKDTHLTERVRLQLRAELFNIFNHPNFALPNFFINPAFQDLGTPGNPNIQPNPSAYDSVTGALLPAGLITQTPDQAQTNPGLGGGGPRVIQLGAKFVF